MPVHYNNKLSDWARNTLSDAGGMTLRQVEIKTGVAYSTVKNILDGRIPDATILIRFASAFGKDVPEALRIAGYEDIATVWETGAAPTRSIEPEPDYNRDEPVDEDEGEVLLFYRGVPNNLKPAAKNMLRSLIKEPADTDLPTFGQGRKAKD